MKKRLTAILLIFVLVTAFKVSKAQNNYFYTSFKVPLFEYIGYAVRNKTANKTDGILMDAGYGIKINRLFAVETGIEYFIFNPYEKEYYQNSTASKPIAELHVKNSAFGFQARPVLKIPFDPDENTTFRLGCSINYLKTFSSGYYYSDPQSSQKTAEDHTDTNFYPTVQPNLGVEFKLSDDWRLGFDFNYIKTNWSKSMRQLEFSEVPDLTVPEHKTSNIFIAGRIVFR